MSKYRIICRRNIGICLILMGSLSQISARAATITTVAGNGAAGFSGDGGPATSAQLYGPGGITVDGHDNLFFTDNRNLRIRKIDSAGIISTAATSSPLDNPWDVTVDSIGNLYVADSQRIRKVDSAGIITTVAGTGVAGFSGDGGPAISAQFNMPIGIIIDSTGNLFIADYVNQRIRKVDSAGIITTVAGTGVAGFSGDGGPATSAQLYSPTGLAIDGIGNLFICEQENHRVRKVDSAGVITTVVGTGDAGFSGDGGSATSAQVNYPVSVVFDRIGNLYIADQGGQRIRKVDNVGIITTIAGTGDPGFSGDGGPATSAQLQLPGDVAFDSAGNLFIADYLNNRIRRVALSNTVIGSNTTSQPVDATTGASPVEMTFFDVNQAGTTSLTTSSAGPPPPAGFKLGNPPVYYDLSTTAVFSGTVTVCINYSGIGFGDESNLKLMHHEGTSWVDRTVSLDTVNDIICAGVTSFSPFAILEGETQGPTTSNSTVTPNLVAFGTGFTLTANVTDTGTGGSTIASAEYSIDGGPYIPMNAADNLFNQVTESVSVGVAPSTASGVYSICIRGKDSQNNFGAPECILVPVYDPSAGFVTGAGWIISPVGAYVSIPSLAGKAGFGFVSKYKKGQTVPTGETEFQFQTAGFNFTSNIYEWLVVSGARAQYKGSGVINGSGNYGFLLTAVDGQINGGGGVDKFRIKIWNKATNLGFYDNQIGSSDGADLTTPGTLLGGGSIVIHSIK